MRVLAVIIMHVGALVEVEPIGPIQVNLPLISRSGGAFYLPPPTTLVGALSYPYLKSKGICSDIVFDSNNNPYSPSIMILNEVVYATAGATFYAHSRQLERVSTIIYQRRERMAELRRVATGDPIKNFQNLTQALGLIYGVSNRGATFANRLYLFYILRDRELAKHVYGIVRLGAKESRVAVKEVFIYEDISKLVKESYDWVETPFYTPESCVASEQNAWLIEMPIITKTNFGVTITPHLGRFYVPLPYSLNRMFLLPNQNSKILHLPERNFNVIVPANLVEG